MSKQNPLLKRGIPLPLFLVCLILFTQICFAATTQNLVYDLNGNLVTGDGKYREYDSFNHLVKVREDNSSGTILEEYGWHPSEDRAVIKHVYHANGTWKETVVYISKSFVQVKNDSGTFNFTYYYQNDQLVAQEDYDGNKNFILADHLGSVTVVTNESGSKVEETWYSPFGEIITGGATSRYDYEAKEYDSVIGDYDFHARRYNPRWGKFEQPDMIIQNVYDPQMLNRYAFERNNPYGNTDPDGKITQLISKLMIVGYLDMAYVYRTLSHSAPTLAMRNEFEQKYYECLFSALGAKALSHLSKFFGKRFEWIESISSSMGYSETVSRFDKDINRYAQAKFGKESFEDLTVDELKIVYFTQDTKQYTGSKKVGTKSGAKSKKTSDRGTSTNSIWGNILVDPMGQQNKGSDSFGGGILIDPMTEEEEEE